MSNKKTEDLKNILKKSEEYVSDIIDKISNLLTVNDFKFISNKHNTELIVYTNAGVGPIRDLVESLNIDDKIIRVLIDTKGVRDTVFIRLVIEK